jgi:hypothetical protein
MFVKSLMQGMYARNPRGQAGRGDARNRCTTTRPPLARDAPAVISVAMSNDWPIPDGLGADGRKAAETIRDFFVDKGITYHGGGGAFYSPVQWSDRGEVHGTDSLLIITHDGGDHAGAFNLDYEQYALREQLQRRLRLDGLFVDACTCWYSAVYRI